MTAVTHLQALDRLTREQEAILNTARRAKYRLREAEALQVAAQARLDRAVYDAMEAGVPARLIADDLNLSPTGIRRMRKTVEEAIAGDQQREQSQT